MGDEMTQDIVYSTSEKKLMYLWKEKRTVSKTRYVEVNHMQLENSLIPYMYGFYSYIVIQNQV